MTIEILNGIELDEAEVDAYKNYITEKYPDREVEKLIISIDGDDVNLETHFKKEPNFQRIRRITGYLVGDMGRWNNGKVAEEADRVKHSVLETMES